MSCEKCGCETAFMKVPHADICVCDRCRQVAELEQQLADAEARLAIYKEVNQFSHAKWLAFHNPGRESDDDK